MILIVIGSGVFFYYQEIALCRNILSYDIGTFDSRFGINKDKFLITIKEAEAVWEKGTGRDLFVYKAGARFEINLIFDERQARTIEANQTGGQIEQSRAYYDSLVAKYKSMSASYDADLRAYNSRVSSFESRLNTYNHGVAQANAKGGATPQEYKELEAERKALETEKNYLDQQRAALNQKAAELNALGEQINGLAEQLNIEVDIFNQRFGEGREFDQGQYTGDAINIYQFDAVGDLRLVLGHELGHALGLDHVENPASLMYYLMDKQNIKNPALSREDLAAFNQLCNSSVINAIRYWWLNTFTSRLQHLHG